ncbi:MAG: acetyl-CoA carboxylase biotin carboxyl carrier protein subunit [Deltaproteobacteria bacterium]|nr:acetyl-CoA carboxylase biotin carboxyl carrier protein subunit [Deltaproteobacteria bacterium]
MGTEYSVSRGGHSRSVELIADRGSEVVVRADGRDIVLHLHRLPDGRTAVRSEGLGQLLARHYRERGEVVVVSGNCDFRYEVTDVREGWLQGGAGGKGGKGGHIKASMPGRVVRLTVQPGDVVPEGGVVAVLEAMKMENDVRAPAGGVVKSVAVAVGQAVETGAVLVELEAAS